MSSIQPAQHKSPLVPSLFKTIRSGYSLGMLSKDVSAGITVGVVALPLALAFAIASGLTPERGLYTSIVAGFFMAFFSGSRFPVSGPTGAFVVIIYSIVSRHGYEGLVLTTLMAGIESLLACVVADSMTGDRHNSNMELISQGIGNVASVFFGGFAATGAIARTATNVRAGAHSSVSAIVHSLFLVVVVMWLLPLTEYIPLAALAAVLVMVAYDMSDLRTVRHIFQGPKSDWSVMILTFALTVIFDLTVAVYTGVMLASLLFMRRMSELTGIHTCVSGEEEEAAAHDIPLPDEETVPDGVEIFAINGPLFFGVADRFQSTLDAMETPPKVFIMYLHNTPAIDMTGIHALEAFLERRQEGCRVLFAAVQEPARRTLQRVGILRTVGEENVFPSLDEALLRAEEILENTIMARGKSFATADFEILKLSRERSKN